MKVIMLKDVGGVGRRGTAVDVSDGYALNSLIPKGFAVQATRDRLAQLEATQKRESASHAAREQQFAEQAKKIEGTTIVVGARANGQGTLFNQLPGEVVIEAIRKQYGISIPPDAIMLNAPIKQVGDTAAKIKLGESMASITISVVLAK